MSRPTDPTAVAAIARGEAQAAADVALGLDNLRAAVATAPDWETVGRRTEPTRQMLAGMLAHLERHQPTKETHHVRPAS